MKISNYDEFGYDYKTYWNNRDYEDKAEKLFLSKVLKEKRGNWFIDVGGSFGRNLSLYSSKYENPVIVDYSLETLQKNYADITNAHPNAHLIAANAYKLPFRDSTFDGGMMIRVLHHIEESDKYFTEMSRVTNGDATYIQEFANKYHIKAILRNLIRFNKQFFNTDQYQQPSHGNFEGTEGQSTVFLNFHPKAIQKQLSENEFVVNRVQGVSFLRIPLLKKLVPTKILIIIERVLQRLFRGKYFTPSVIMSAIKQGAKNVTPKTLSEVLACPECHANLEITSDKATCIDCKKVFNKSKNVWDFRI